MRSLTRRLLVCSTLALGGCPPIEDPLPNGPRVVGDRVIVGDEHSRGVVVFQVDHGEVVDIDRIGLAGTSKMVKVPDHIDAPPRAFVLTDSSLERLDLSGPSPKVDRLALGSSLTSLAVSDDGDVAVAASASRIVRTRFTSRAVTSVVVGDGSSFSAEAFFPGSHIAVVTATEAMFLVDADAGLQQRIELGSDPTPDRALAVIDAEDEQRIVGLATSDFGTPAFVTMIPTRPTAPVVHVVRGELDQLVQVGAHVVAWGEGTRVFVMPVDGSAEPVSYGFAHTFVAAAAIDDEHIGFASEDAVVRLDILSGVQDELGTPGRVLSLHARQGRLVAAVEVGSAAELFVFVQDQPPRVVAVPGSTTAAVVVPGGNTLAAVRLVEGGRAVFWDETALDDAPRVAPGFFLHQYLEREDGE